MKKNNKCYLSLLCCLLSFLLLYQNAFCAGHQKKKSSSTEPPAWVKETPMRKGQICGVGVAGKTYFQTQAQQYASEKAREEIARTLQVRIRSIMVEFTSQKGTYADQASFQQVASWATDIAVSGSVIVSTWYDAEGLAGPEGYTYALACMSLNPEVINFAEKAQPPQSAGNPADVKQRAEDLFKKLEEMENQGAKAPKK